jgi:uncharacterized HAD superfamily protein
LKDAKKVSIKWLKKNKLHFDKIIVNANNKGQVCKDNNIEIFIDDLPRNIESVSSSGIKTFIMNSVTNEDYKKDNVVRVYSFVDFYRHIKKISEAEGTPKTFVMNVNKKYFKN